MPSTAHAGQQIALRGSNCSHPEFYWHDSRNIATRGTPVRLPFTARGTSVLATYRVTATDSKGNGSFNLLCDGNHNGVALLLVD